MNEDPMPYRFLNHVSLSLVLALTPGVPAFAEDGAPASAKSIEDVKSRNKCYEKQLETCKNASKAASVVFSGNVNNAVSKNDGETKTQVDQTAKAQQNGGASMSTVAGNCQKDASKCKDICADESKKAKSQDPISHCKEDFKTAIDLINGSAAGLTRGGLEMAGAGHAMAADGPGGTNGTATTPGDGKGTARAEGGGSGSGIGSAMGMMLPIGLMAGMMAMKQQKDDDEQDEKDQERLLKQMQLQQQQQQYALQANQALQVNGTVDCSKADAGYYSDCNTYLVAACQQAMTNSTFSASPTCTNFAGRYCGTNTGGVYTVPYQAPAVVGVSATTGTTGTATTMPTMGLSGEGRATNFCTSALAYNYCQTPGRLNCPSCQNLTSSTSAGCAQNPALCLGQTSQAIINQARTTCPDDPMFANPANTLVAGAPVASPAVNSIITGAPAVLPTTASASGLQTASLDGRNLAATGSTGGPTSDITGQYGPSVFSTSTQTISKLCQTGQLNCP